MIATEPADPSPSYRLPLIVVCVQLTWIFGFPFLAPGSTIQYPFIVYGAVPTAGTLALLYWFLSREARSRSQRIAAFTVVSIWLLSHATLLHPSLKLLRVFAFQPLVTSAMVLTLFVTRRRPASFRLRSVTLLLLSLTAIACCLKMRGMSGAMVPTLAWRWQREHELAPQPITPPPAEPASHPVVEPGEQDWPGFRGAHRDGIVRHDELNVTWKETPPTEVWRANIGPGWSSFCVVADLAWTQEQRGPNEIISCRRVSKDQLVWERSVEGRFEDTSSGTGPRSTPAYADGRLYALTATGELLCLDASTGESLWSVDLKVDFDAELPHWGFASSPLVVDGSVMVFTGAGDGKSVAALNSESGELRWSGGTGTHGYSSPHWCRLHGQDQLVIASNHGLESLDPSDGTQLWRHDWDIGLSPRIVQPCLLPDNGILLATAYGKGSRRLQILRHSDRWSVDTAWTNRRFKPYFNDFVYFNGYFYGFDGSLLTCVDATTGKQTWRQRGFGNGQLLLLRSQKTLLVLSEEGRVSLVAAQEDRFERYLEFQALHDKTWNHPVVSQSYLLLRNGAEAACYRW